MMISSTSMTSTSGVTLMSAVKPPLFPPTFIDITKSPCYSVRQCGWFARFHWCAARVIRKGANPVESPNRRSGRTRRACRALCSIADEVVDELRRGVVHLHVEVLNARRQVVVDPDGRNGDNEAERGLDERFRDTDRHGADTGGSAVADALKRVDDANDGAEQPDEGGGRPDGRERRDALL